MFESSVVLDGTKTINSELISYEMFESSVVLDGTKTIRSESGKRQGLRVVLF